MPGPITLEVYFLDRPRPGIRVLARDTSGTKGAGEGFPLAVRSSEDLASAGDWIGSLEIEGDPLARAREIEGLLGPEYPVATFAVESALLDLASRQRQEPIWRLLRGGDDTPEPPPVNALLPAHAEPTILMVLAREAIVAGHQTLKLKLAGDFDLDLVRLRALRKTIEPGIGLRVDVNAAWSLDEAPARLEALAEFDLEFVEQPVPAADLPELETSPVPVGADESLSDPAICDRLLESRRAQVFVLKPGALGILRSLVLATRARAAGLDVVITHADDGTIALERARAVAWALAPLRLACGLASSA